MLLFSDTTQGDKEIKELEKAIISLFHSGQKENQVIAMMQCKTIGLSLGNLVWDYVKSSWNKKKIMNEWGLAYYEGIQEDDEYIVFECDFLGDKLQIIDMVHAVYVSIPTVKGMQKLTDWGESGVDVVYHRTFKAFKTLCLNIGQIINKNNI
jgi:hypothetical protein